MSDQANSNYVLGIIPTRFDSQRFPGKPLALIAGKTLLQTTYENALNSGCFDKLVIATDDVRIWNHAHTFGAEVYMTPASCASGTERLAALLESHPEWAMFSTIVNVQGDEPCVSKEAFRTVIDTLKNNPDASMATLVSPLTDLAAAQNPSVVKCVRDKQGYALYFSRALIPGSKALDQLPTILYRHIGIYAFTRSFLMQYSSLENTPLQLIEDLEQLKLLEHGYRIATACVHEVALGVDHPQDLVQIEKLLCTVNLSS